MKSILLFFLILWSLDGLTLSQEQHNQQEQRKEQQILKNDTTTVNGTLVEEFPDPLDVLGEPEWTRLRPGWSLTVNDQCLYEFVFQFQHDQTLPIGDDEYKGKCEFGEFVEPKIAPEDGQRYLKPRQMWEQFPPYVWATLGFNHLSVDFLPCGQRPKGYTTPQYDFSFFRVTPEYRAETMVCKLIADDQGAVPGEQICLSNQEEPKGMNFYIVPGAMIDRTPVVNMPFNFERPDNGYGPIPHYGLRSWDQGNVPNSPREWNDIPIVMSSYNGNLVMWQAHVPYKMVSGDKSQFHSGAARYFETTVQTLPDTWAVHYDESDGMIRFVMVGKAGICSRDFERAQEAAGGQSIFPSYDDLYVDNDEQNKDDGSETDDDSDGEVIPSGASRSIFSFRNSISIATVQIMLLLYIT